MRYDQEPKYEAVCSCGRDGQHTWIQNRASGEPIPDEEPVVIFRGRDRHLIPLLAHYMTLCQDSDHREAIRRRMQEVAGFQSQHPDRVKEPDTVYADPPGKLDVHLDPDPEGAPV